jgi:hypothetical protein
MARCEPVAVALDTKERLTIVAVSLGEGERGHMEQVWEASDRFSLALRSSLAPIWGWFFIRRSSDSAFTSKLTTAYLTIGITLLFIFDSTISQPESISIRAVIVDFF